MSEVEEDVSMLRTAKQGRPVRQHRSGAAPEGCVAVVGGIGDDATYVYSTTACPTGNEQTCGDTKQRELSKASIQAGQTFSGYDLCDYYYTDSNTPKF